MEELLVELVNPDTFEPNSCCIKCHQVIVVKFRGDRPRTRRALYEIRRSQVLVCDSETEELSIIPAYFPVRHRCPALIENRFHNASRSQEY